MKTTNLITLIAFLLPFIAHSQVEVPAVYTNIESSKEGLIYNYDGNKIAGNISKNEFYTLNNLIGNPKGNEEGFVFDFKNAEFEGELYIGLVNYKDYKYPHPVYFKRTSKIEKGIANVNMTKLKGRYDMSGWEQSNRGHLGYRVMDDKGKILYDGLLSFEKKDEFIVLPSIIEGPILSSMTDSSVTVRYVTNRKVLSEIKSNKTVFKDKEASKIHELTIVGLEANKKYDYSINCAGNTFTYNFTTAPKSGSRSNFTFAYVSDARAGIGGGERNIYGVNAYVLKKAMALSLQQNAVFMQFSGDLINGYSNSREKTELQYANFKKVISPFAAYMPFNASIGNHEVLGVHFPIEESYGILLDGFPFETESMEAVFANQFANPTNGPESEDGKSYDPNPNKIDFPSYKENVYFYTYDNVAVVVLNSEYLYTANLGEFPETSGGLHGYLMDTQLDWLEQIILDFESDANIDHVFVTQHTPVFPNGGHTHDAMWYDGDNSYRTIIAGKGMKTGVIEQRDRYLDIIVNKSSKVKAVLTGDEHNYCKTHITEKMNRYPENWDKKKVKLSRSLYQINNGACGAPYYAQDLTMPWTKYTSGFSTQNALVLFDVKGAEVKVRILNPDTLEEIESYDLILN